MIELKGATAFGATGSYKFMLDALRRGEVVAIGSDVPGRTPMTFLGREVLGASGMQKLAIETGAMICPMTVRPHRIDQRLVCEEPIDSREFTDPAALQQAVLARHEPSILAWPAAYSFPAHRWLPTPEDTEFATLHDNWDLR
jgi:lauroyl/myristoyl acyltransferase